MDEASHTKVEKAQCPTEQQDNGYEIKQTAHDFKVFKFHISFNPLSPIEILCLTENLQFCQKNGQ